MKPFAPFPTRTLCAVVAAALSPTLATADACLEEFRDFYLKNMNVEARAPFRMTEQTADANGAPLRSMVFEVASMVDTLTVSPGAPVYRQAGRILWTAPGLEGPWSEASELPEGLEDIYRQQHADRAANLRDVACHGTVEREGTPYLSYSWTTQTSPDAQGSYFGGSNVGFFDLETGLPAVIELTGTFGHWAPDPSTEVNLQTFEYPEELDLPDPVAGAH